MIVRRTGGVFRPNGPALLSNTVRPRGVLDPSSTGIPGSSCVRRGFRPAPDLREAEEADRLSSDSACRAAKPALHIRRTVCDAVPMVRRVSRRTVLAALSLPSAGSVASCLGPDWGPFPRTAFTVATGNPGGVFARYGGALSTVIGRSLTGITSTAKLTDAPVENVRMVSDGTCDLGFSLGDTASDATRGTGTFDAPVDVVALARTYDSFVHLVVRDDSPIKTTADLRGHRVGVGATGSGTRVVARRILQHSGLNLSDIAVSSQPLQASAKALLDGSLSAFFFASGLPSQAVLSLSRHVPIRLVSLQEVVGPMAGAYGPQYAAGPIPASAYGLLSAVDTVSVKNHVVAGRHMPTRLAYAVTRLMFEAQDAIDRLAPGVRQPSTGAAIFTSPLGLHPGAVRYFRKRRG